MQKSTIGERLKRASLASFMHLGISATIAVGVAALLFMFWYPHPFGELAGGKDLFYLIVSVDVVCGPLLTMILFSPLKPRTELIRDLSLVGLIQIVALVYGVWTVWQARPLYLVAEIDRFKVISATALPEDFRVSLPPQLIPGILDAPLTVGIRPPKDIAERSKVMMESVMGGRDYAERPDFYIAFDKAAAQSVMNKSRPLNAFLEKFPLQAKPAEHIVKSRNLTLESAKYVPVVGRQDWIAILDVEGQIVGFLPGDGF